MTKPHQMPDLVSKGRLKVECAKRAVSRELLERTKHNVGLGDKSPAVIEDSRLGRSSLRVAAEEQNVLRRLGDRDNANTVTCGSCGTYILPVRCIDLKFDVGDVLPGLQTSADRTHDIAVSFDISRGSCQ